MPLSVAIVCKNNESTIGSVLEAARALLALVGGGEIVAVDSGSIDRTIPLLEAVGARVIRSPWLGYVRTKQLAFEEAGKALDGRGFVLCLDSDEPPDERLRESIARTVRSDDPAVSGARMNRKIWYRGRYLHHAWQPEWRLRLARPGRVVWAGEDPHDRMDVVDGGRVVDLEGTLRHDSFFTFVEHLGKQVSHAKVAAASMHAAGRRTSWRKLVISPAGAFLKQIVIKGAWRDGYAGWLVAGSTAAGALMKHMALLEMQYSDVGW